MVKTIDGLKLESVVKAVATCFSNIYEGVKQGASHPYLLMVKGARPIPVASSTDVRRMVAPELRAALGYKQSAQTIYEILRRNAK